MAAPGTSGIAREPKLRLPPRRGQRPQQLTEQAVRKICKLVEGGVPQTAAAASLGIPTRSFQRWLAQGREEGAKEPYVSLAERLEEALARFHASRAILVAESGDARLTLDVLERRFPADWGRVERVEATIQARPFIDASKLSLAEQATLLELLRKAAPAQEELPPEGRAALELVAGEQP